MRYLLTLGTQNASGAGEELPLLSDGGGGHIGGNAPGDGERSAN